MEHAQPSCFKAEILHSPSFPSANMSHPNFDDPTAFFDPEDPEIVRNAKSIYPEPVEYDFTEVWNHVLCEIEYF